MDRNYDYFIDRDGNIWHEGTMISDPRFASIVFRSMEATADGLLVRCQGENCFLEVEDVPYVIQDVALHTSEVGGIDRVGLLFPGGYLETLDPCTLEVSVDHVLYCTVRKGKFQARFSRNAYFKFAALLDEDLDCGEYYVEINSIRYAIRPRA